MVAGEAGVRVGRIPSLMFECYLARHTKFAESFVLPTPL